MYGLAFRNDQIFYMEFTDIRGQGLEVNDDGVQHVGRICFIVNLIQRLLYDTLSGILIFQNDLNRGGDGLTGDQSLKIQSHDLFLHGIIVDIFYKGIDLFSVEIKHYLSTFFVGFDKAEGFRLRELNGSRLLHFFSVKDAADETVASQFLCLYFRVPFFNFQCNHDKCLLKSTIYSVGFIDLIDNFFVQFRIIAPFLKCEPEKL